MGLETTLTWTAIVAAATWFGTRIFEWIKSYLDDKRERDRFLRALHAEIDLNVLDFEEFVENRPPLSAIRAKMEKDTEFTPYITYTRLDGIFKSKIGVIHHAKNSYIANLMNFYYLMEKIDTEVKGIYTPAFKVISISGRLSTIEELYESGMRVVEVGSQLLDEMEADHATLKTKRLSGRSADRGEPRSLEERYSKLKLDLDLARSASSFH